MPDKLYVCLQDDNRIVGFAIDAESGRLTPQGETAAPGGPSVTALSPDRRVLYVGHRTEPAISSFRIDPADGALSLLATVPQMHAPTFLAPDRRGKYMLIAYYQGGYAAVHPIGADSAVAAAAIDHQDTATGAHAIQTDPSNRFAFVPHIARLNDNVLEPPKNNPGPNFIAQFRFDEETGRLSANSPFRVEPAAGIGPRHYCFHPSLDVVYFSDEQGCSVSRYRLDRGAGTLSHQQTIGSLPAGFTGRNTCSQIHMTPSGRFLYTANRGHNSLAAFAVDAASGQLSAAGHVATEAVPGAFALDPAGRFVYAAGNATGRIASYRIDERRLATTASTAPRRAARRPRGSSCRAAYPTDARSRDGRRRAIRPSRRASPTARAPTASHRWQ
jgi:6-phosphogluconolactonase